MTLLHGLELSETSDFHIVIVTGHWYMDIDGMFSVVEVDAVRSEAVSATASRCEMG